MILVAIWVFLGPYAVTLVMRAEVTSMVAGPPFLLATPVMFLFLKYYALANFGGMFLRIHSLRGKLECRPDCSDKLPELSLLRHGIISEL